MSEVFLDTSIQIARWVHSPGIKSHIANRLRNYTGAVTSLVVRQEFKRRLLKEAQYLLNQFNDKGSFEKVIRHVADVLPYQGPGKRNICLEMLLTTFEEADDTELTERAKRYLRQLLRVGLSDFDASVDYLIWDSGCACSRLPVVEKAPYKRYDFGSDKCSKTGSTCGVVEFLRARDKEMRNVLEYLKDLPEGKKSQELRDAEVFIQKAFEDTSSIEGMDPCLTVGDLLIAMESAEIPAFYTLNSKESQHLCRALGQTLVVRPKNPEREDVVCLSTDDWPEF